MKQREGMIVAESYTDAMMWHFNVDEIYAAGKTKYQDYQIGMVPGFGKTLFLDYKIQSSSFDEYIFHECMAQPALTLHPNPKSAVVCGGGEGATLREVLRHNTIEKAAMVDIDGELIQAVEEHMPEWHQGAFKDPRTTMAHVDARGWLEERKGAGFDVILSDLPDPLEGGPAMYLFTKEYFQIAADAMSEDGVFAMQAGSAAEVYPGLFSCCMETLESMKETFPYVAGYYGLVNTFLMPWGFIIASKKHDPFALTVEEIERRHRERGIENRYYTGRFHQAMFTLPEYLLRARKEMGRVLTDAEPFVWKA